MNVAFLTAHWSSMEAESTLYSLSLPSSSSLGQVPHPPTAWQPSSGVTRGSDTSTKMPAQPLLSALRPLGGHEPFVRCSWEIRPLPPAEASFPRHPFRSHVAAVPLLPQFKNYDGFERSNTHTRQEMQTIQVGSKAASCSCPSLPGALQRL